MRLSNLTWPKAEEYFRAHDTVLIGIGSIECHGRHMPQIGRASCRERV